MEKQSKKQRQVGTIIQREFSNVLRDIGSFIYGNEVLVTVTNVRMSSDMGIAYIYLSVYNALYKQEVIKELWENLSRLRGDLGSRIRKHVRRVPMIKFYLDDTLDQAEHIDRLFEKLNTSDNMRSMKDAMKERESEDNNTEE